jgi:Ca2+-binding EF-hand superfamily protein
LPELTRNRKRYLFITYSKLYIMTLEEKQALFNKIDKDGSGTIEFREWYKQFDALLRPEGSTWTEQKLLALYKKYQGDSAGVNFDEYCAFMKEVVGE